MNKLVLTVGISNSGKTTWAEKMARSSKWVNLNLDDLRRELSSDLHMYKYDEVTECSLREKQKEAAIKSFHEGKNVIISDTNLDIVRRDTWREIADKYGVEYSEQVFDVPLKVCMERNIKRAHSIPPDAILKQSQRMREYLGKPFYIAYPEGRKTIICDIDGTIMHMNRETRSPYEWDKVGEDTPDHTIIEILHRYKHDHDIILVSGRDEVCRRQTVSSMLHHDVPFDEIYMRPEGSNNSDVEVKENIFFNNLSDRNIVMVLDDRDSVVWMWREIGLKVLQVAPGGF